MTIYSGFTHWKWWFSIVMLVCQRVFSMKFSGQGTPQASHPSAFPGHLLCWPRRYLGATRVTWDSKKSSKSHMAKAKTWRKFLEAGTCSLLLSNINAYKCCISENLWKSWRVEIPNSSVEHRFSPTSPWCPSSFGCSPWRHTTPGAVLLCPCPWELWMVRGVTTMYYICFILYSILSILYIHSILIVLIYSIIYRIYYIYIPYIQLYIHWNPYIYIM